MHAAVGDSNWFSDAVRMQALVDGWAEGCKMAGRSGAARNPTLRGIVEARALCWPARPSADCPKALRITGDVKDGDAIIFLASTGVQTNGLSLCR